VRLYDVGDTSMNYPSGDTRNDAQLEVLTPAGDIPHVDGTPKAGSDGTPYPSSLSLSYSAAPGDTSSGYAVATETPLLSASNQILATNAYGTHPYKGSWLTIEVPLTWNGSYAGMVRTFGGYWKMLYNIGGNASDTTTWEINISGSPVHLVTE
jgi:hypothetical protein